MTKFKIGDRVKFKSKHHPWKGRIYKVKGHDENFPSFIYLIDLSSKELYYPIHQYHLILVAKSVSIL